MMTFNAPQLNQNAQSELQKLDAIPVENEPEQFEEPVQIVQSHCMPVKTADVDYPVINGDAWDFCTKISRSTLLPESIRSTPEHDHTAEVYMVMSMGKELGFTFMQTLSALYILPGSTQPALYTRAKRALVLRAGGIFEKEEWDNSTMTATVTINRNGQKITRSFGAEDAINMGKAYRDATTEQIKGCVTRNGKPSPWAQDFKGMCLVRAVSRACDAAYPDVLMALPSAEDLNDQGTVSTVSSVTVESSAALPADEVNPAITSALKPKRKRSAKTAETVTNTEQPTEPLVF